MSNFKKFSTKRASKRSAFTLIELSIVLIIIGLLVVGVTGGNSLVQASKLRSLMSEVTNYQTAVNTFKAVKQSLPGDYDAAIVHPTNPGVLKDAIAGDGDGQIEFIAGQGSTAGSIIEGINAWYHLINSETIDLTLANLDVATSDVLNPANGAVINVAQVPGTHMPDSKFDDVGYMFTNSTDGNVMVATGTIALGITTVEATALQNFEPVGAISPNDSSSIDAKMDDGSGNSGNVQASQLIDDAASTGLNLDGTAGGTVTLQELCFENSTGAYNTVNSNDTCALEFTVDIS
jgi:prepilin-type N-terminal cleavage/methylation domain-containing protein